MPALAGILVVLRDENHQVERHFASAIYNEPTEDHGDHRWARVVSHAGSRLLADLADRTGLTQDLSEAVGGMRQRRSAHQ